MVPRNKTPCTFRICLYITDYAIFTSPPERILCSPIGIGLYCRPVLVAPFVPYPPPCSAHARLGSMKDVSTVGSRC